MPQSGGLPRVDPPRLALLTGAVLITVAAAALVLPGDLRLLAIPLALLGGMAIERYRQSYAPIPPALGETPAEWADALRGVGVGYAFFATLLLAAAIAFLVVSGASGPNPGVESATEPAAPNAPPPALEARTKPVGEPFRASGASFTVVPRPRQPWAQALAAERAPQGGRWVPIAVRVRNVDRRGINPARLPYRLQVAGGGLYTPERASAVGPASLGAEGAIKRGQSAEMQLGFAVGGKERPRALLFSTAPNGPRVRVPLND